MKKKAVLLPAALLLLTLCVSCGGGGKAMDGAFEPNAVMATTAPNPGEMTESDYLMSTMETPGGESGGVGAQVYAKEDAKLIRRARLAMQTTEFDKTLEALDRLTDACGGYYETVETQGSGYYDRGTGRWAVYTVRVPQERYTDFMGQVGEIGHVLSRNESSEDIGREYHDAELRLETQQTKQDRLLSLLEKAEKMEDIISLENALAETTYEIEALTSTLKTNDSLVNFATIDLELNEVVKLTETTGEAAPLSVRVGNAFRKGVDSFGTAMGDLAVWLAYHFIGVLVFAAVVIVAAIIVRRKRGLTKKKKLPPEGENHS